jgi:hypothetical protein
LNVLIPDENIYVLSNLSLLGRNAISQTWVELPKYRQRIRQGRGRAFDLNLTVSVGKFTQGGWNVKRHV